MRKLTKQMLARIEANSLAQRKLNQTQKYRLVEKAYASLPEPKLQKATEKAKDKIVPAFLADVKAIPKSHIKILDKYRATKQVNALLVPTYFEVQDPEPKVFEKPNGEVVKRYGTIEYRHQRIARVPEYGYNRSWGETVAGSHIMRWKNCLRLAADNKAQTKREYRYTSSWVFTLKLDEYVTIPAADYTVGEQFCLPTGKSQRSFPLPRTEKAVLDYMKAVDAQYKRETELIVAATRLINDTGKFVELLEVWPQAFELFDELFPDTPKLVPSTMTVSDRKVLVERLASK